MDPPTNGTPGRDVLIEMIKTQMDKDHMVRDQDARRDAFLCLAVTLPPRQRARIKAAMGPLLARARIKGSGRDPAAAPDCAPNQHDQHQQGHDPQLHRNGNDCDVAAEVEARLGLMSTLCVLGCQYISSFLSLPDVRFSHAHSLHFSVWFHPENKTQLPCMETQIREEMTKRQH